MTHNSMIDYIKSTFKIGQDIRISGIEGQFEGSIEHFGKDFIVLREPNNAIRGIHASAVQTFSTLNAKSPIFHNSEVRLSSILTPYTTPPAHSHLDYAPAGESNITTSDHDASHISSNEYTNDESSTIGAKPQTNASKGIRQFKPGDKIPLKELEQIDPSVKKHWKHTERKKQENENSPEFIQGLRALLDDIQDEGNDEDKRILEATGHIIEFQPTFNFAFIDDKKDGTRYFFNKSDIVDESMREMSGKDIPVAYTRTKNFKGNAAKSVHRVMSILEVLKLSLELFEKNDSYRAVQVLRNAHVQFSESKSLDRFLTFITKNKNEDVKIPNDNRTDDAIDKAKAAKLEKNYTEAIKFYLDALKRGVRVELCIKEIMQLYTSLHSQEEDPEKKEEIKREAVDFIYEYRDKLPYKGGALGVLENVYYAFGLYNDHIDVVEDLITLSGRKGDLAQYTFYLNKAAMSYWHLNDLDRALDACRQGLEVEPGNPHLLKTLQLIMETPGYVPSNEY